MTRVIVTLLVLCLAGQALAIHNQKVHHKVHHHQKTHGPGVLEKVKNFFSGLFKGESAEEAKEDGKKLVTTYVSDDEADDSKDCKFRVRKEWRDMTPTEKQTFVNAVNHLKKTMAVTADKVPLQVTVYDSFIDMYQKAVDSGFPNGRSVSLPWHRQFIRQFENALRSTGSVVTGAECITLPYWDWTRDYMNQDSLRTEVFGVGPHSFGSLKAGCVVDGAFAGWEDGRGNCLKRQPQDKFRFSGPASIQQILSSNPTYGTHEAGFRRQLESGVQGFPQLWMGGQMESSRAAADPLFFLHRCFIDRLWAVWQDCHNYDQVAETELDTSIHYTPITGDEALDAVMPPFKEATPRSQHSIWKLGYGYKPDEWMEAAKFSEVCDWHWFTSDNSNSDAESLLQVGAATRTSNLDPAQYDMMTKLNMKWASLGEDQEEKLHGSSDDDDDVDDTFESGQDDLPSVEEVTEDPLSYAGKLNQLVDFECETIGPHQKYTMAWIEMNGLSKDMFSTSPLDPCKAYARERMDNPHKTNVYGMETEQYAPVDEDGEIVE